MLDKSVADHAPYAVHYTNLADFLKIVESGRLYSRSLAEFYGGEFSHNTALSDKVMADTDHEIKNYARLALNPANNAFYHFKNKHGKDFVVCEMRFSFERLYTLPRLRLSAGEDRPAAKLKFTRELPRLRYEDFLEKVDALAEHKMAELLVFGEVPLCALTEVVVIYNDIPPALGEAEGILKDNGTVITMRKK